MDVSVPPKAFPADTETPVMGSLESTAVPAHGGNLALADRRYGAAKWLDVSANINPLGCPDPVKQALMTALQSGCLEHYPDPASTTLREAFAERHGLHPEQVMPANGASEALWLALEVLPRGEVAIPVPSFSEYQQAAHRMGHTVQPIWTYAPDFEVPRPTRRYTGVVLGHPNNPTSRLQRMDCLLSWLDACDWAIVDEAFLGLTLEGETASLAPMLACRPNLILLRALTKELALPGLRIGYALGSGKWMHRMREHQVPWSVNAMAQAVAGALPQLGGYGARTRAWLEVEPAWLYQRVGGLGVQAVEPQANFILCKGSRPAGEIVAGMAQKGILVRDASNFAGLDEWYFRVAVRLRPDNERVVAALEEEM